MRVLVTGADGFVGQHLLAHLLDLGHEAAGTHFEKEPRLRTLSSEQAEAVKWQRMDLRDPDTVARTVEAIRPEAVVHLAGVASSVQAFRQPQLAYQVNVLGTRTLLQNLAEAAGPGVFPRTVIAGSGDAYGAAAREGLPLREDRPLRPLGPYPASKAAQEMVALEFGLTGRLRVVVARAFNHTGPGQRPPYVVPDWAAQLLHARKGTEGSFTLKVGNLGVRRDFCDVRDVARAYALLLGAGESGDVVNVCSGRAVSMEEILDLLREATGVAFGTETDPERVREDEVREFRGSFERLRALTGWEPAIPLSDTVADLVAELRGAPEMDAPDRGAPRW